MRNWMQTINQLPKPLPLLNILRLPLYQSYLYQFYRVYGNYIHINEYSIYVRTHGLFAKPIFATRDIRPSLCKLSYDTDLGAWGPRCTDRYQCKLRHVPLSPIDEGATRFISVMG